MTAHDPERRAEAATRPRFELPDPDALRGAKAGRKKSGGHWVAVRGPYLRTVRSTDVRSRTGVAGISYSRERKGPGCKPRRYFCVQLGAKKRRFNIDTLGKELAWERALRCRAEHERRVREANRRILAARAATEERSLA
ncbi:MAG TPA: hypothetical protein VIM61_00575 [Chthoniobacterales bacterium]